MAAPMETPPGMGQPAGEQHAGTGLAVGTVRPRSVSSLCVRSLQCSCGCSSGYRDGGRAQWTGADKLFSVCVGLRCHITSGVMAARTTSAWVSVHPPLFPRTHHSVLQTLKSCNRQCCLHQGLLIRSQGKGRWHSSDWWAANAFLQSSEEAGLWVCFLAGRARASS